jgi:hypothetical protein
MVLRHRLRKLEGAIRQPATSADRMEFTEENALLYFATLGRQGQYDHEPDFPTALEQYRAALVAAQAQADPPFDPPEHFMPRGNPRARRTQWRTDTRFPQVFAAWRWLMEMWKRKRDGVPPVSEGEFAELAAWYEAHAALLPAHAMAVATTNVRYGLTKGARALGAGRVAEDIRRLRAAFHAASVEPSECRQ